MNARLAPLLVLLAATTTAGQITYYVNGVCGDNAWSGLSSVCQAPDGPKKFISPAVALAAAGDTVVVAPGTYVLTNDIAMYEPIELRSSEGPYLTILEGQDSDDPAIRVANLASDEAAVLRGFTVRNFTAFWSNIFVDESRVILIDCRFLNNAALASGVVGGPHGAKADAVNCMFMGNSGDASIFQGVGFNLTNCTMAGNFGNVTINVYGESVIANTIIRGPGPHVLEWFEGIVAYSNVEGTYPGDGNLDADPLFADEAAGDLRLLPGSPCIDAGSNPAVPGWVLTDIAGLPRFLDDPATPDTGLGTAPIVDMGAHEFQLACYGDFTGDGVLDLFDFLAFVNAFNADDPAADCDSNGWLDLFDFLCFTNSFNAGC